MRPCRIEIKNEKMKKTRETNAASGIFHRPDQPDWEKEKKKTKFLFEEGKAS
jgi:hypothetical protein